MTPKDFGSFIGPKQQRVLEWSWHSGEKINFRLEILFPLSPSKHEYVCRVLELALEDIRNEARAEELHED